MNLTEKIKEKAREIGFNKVGITDTAPFSEKFKERYFNWLTKGYNVDMEYLRRTAEDRLNPGSIFEGARSIISVAINYYPGEIEIPAGKDKSIISRYALGCDYHEVVSEKLQTLFDFIKREIEGKVNGRIICDDGPLFEKKLAERAGLGWIGKNCLLITKEFGSWIFLGEIVLDRELESDTRADNLCFDCTICIESCPTGAIIEPGSIDLSRCISYHTIENRKGIPIEIRSKQENRIFGCDACQEVCPFNNDVTRTEEELFIPRKEFIPLSLEDALRVTLNEFSSIFRNSQIKRARKERLVRNIIIAMGNSENRKYIPLIESASREFDPIVKEHANWAVQQIVGSSQQTDKRHKS